MKRRLTVGAIFLIRPASAIRVCALLLLVSACSSSAGEAGSGQTRVALQWLPQSQFAGFYMARDKGFYEKEGLDVVLLHTGPGPSPLDFLVEQRADYATLFLADAIVNAREPVPLAHVGQLARRSNLMLVAWKKDGIESPSDLDGKRVSCWPGAFFAAFQAFFNLHGIKPIVLPQNNNINLFLLRGVSACAAMFYNEYHRIYQAGIDSNRLTIFMMRDWNLGFPEDGLYTTARRAEERPDECRALMRATMAGWRYAREHEDEAIEAVLRESRLNAVPANRAHARWMLEQMLSSIFYKEEEGAVGELGRAEYDGAASILKEAGLIEQPLSFEIFAPITRVQQ